MLKRYLLSAVIVCISTIQLFSQSQDLEVWNSIKIEKKLIKKLNASLSLGSRFNENVSKVKLFHSDLGLSYSLDKYIKFDIGYRFIRQQTDIMLRNYNNRHRFTASITLKQKVKRFKIAFRTRYQSKYDEFFTNEDSHMPTNYNRNKFTLGYNIKKNPISPFLAFEFFYRLNTDHNDINKLRSYAGINYKINKRSSFDIIYFIQQQVNVVNPMISHVLSVKYAYSFK